MNTLQLSTSLRQTQAVVSGYTAAQPQAFRRSFFTPRIMPQNKNAAKRTEFTHSLPRIPKVQTVNYTTHFLRKIKNAAKLKNAINSNALQLCRFIPNFVLLIPTAFLLLSYFKKTIIVLLSHTAVLDSLQPTPTKFPAQHIAI